MLAVEFKAVSKNFAGRAALTRFSFAAEAGKVLGLLGPNGSGKTTTLRLILNLFYPDDGEVRVLGAAPNPGVSDRVGYLPEERGLYRRMRVTEVLSYYARLKGVRPSGVEISDWLSRLGITEFQHKRIQELSKGTAQKVQFIATVLHRPELLILDEPFSGLDPKSREQLRMVVKQIIAAGTSVILSTHDMTEAENLCDRFVMLSRGHKVLDRSKEGLGQSTGAKVIKLRALGPLPIELTQPYEGAPLVTHLVEHGSHRELHLAEHADSNIVLKRIADACTVEHFELVRPTLEHVFLELAGASMGAEAP